MGILGDTHGLDLIAAPHGLADGPDELIKLEFYSFKLCKKLLLMHFSGPKASFREN